MGRMGNNTKMKKKHIKDYNYSKNKHCKGGKLISNNAKQCRFCKSLKRW